LDCRLGAMMSVLEASPGAAFFTFAAQEASPGLPLAIGLVVGLAAAAARASWPQRRPGPGGRAGVARRRAEGLAAAALNQKGSTGRAAGRAGQTRRRAGVTRATAGGDAPRAEEGEVSRYVGGSYWDDIPLWLEGGRPADVNMVVEIPRLTSEKNEVSTERGSGHPIIRDTTSEGLPRSYSGVTYWNYGMLPQTWEAPVGDPPGDRDPLDIVDLGTKIRKVGEIVPVRIIGALPLVDTGEMDWKLLGIAEDECDQFDCDDVYHLLENTNVVSSVKDFFRLYKVAEGKARNEFLNDGIPLGREEALGIIREMHEHWRCLRADELPV